MGMHKTSEIYHRGNLAFDLARSLPFQYQDLNITKSTRPLGFRYSKYIISVQALIDNHNISSCGEAQTLELATTKAIAELVERTSLIMLAGKNASLPYKTSNGWAAHSTEELAKENAFFERIERDAGLAQWFSQTPFLEISFSSLPQQIKSWASDELVHSEFPILKFLLTTEGLGPSVTCILMNQNGFGASGHSSGKILEDSFSSAIAEACRSAHHTLRRSFWKDTTLLKDNFQQARVQPGAHAVYYAYHEPFPAWMFGKVISMNQANQYWNDANNHCFKNFYPDFKFELRKCDPFFVAFATHPECLDIEWGATNPSRIAKLSSISRFKSYIERKVLNTKPHINS